MSGVGFWELILVFVIGLIVLGPERLPRVASQLGTWLGQARRMTRVMKRQLEDELNLEQYMSDSPRPRPSALPPPVTAKRQEEFDDTYSPAHDANGAGAGAGVNDTDSHHGDSDADAVTGTVDDADKEPGEPAAPEKTT